MIGVGLKILTRTPVPTLPRVPPHPGLKLFTFCVCKLCAIIFFASSCPNYAQYHLELLTATRHTQLRVQYWRNELCPSDERTNHSLGPLWIGI